MRLSIVALAVLSIATAGCASSRGAIATVAFSPDGRLVASGSEDGQLRIWTVEGERVRTIEHEDAVSCVAFSPDGRLVAAAYGDSVRLYAASTGAQLCGFRIYGSPVSALAFSPGSSRLVTASGDALRFWDVSRDPLGKLVHTIAEGGVRTVSFTGDGKTMMTSSEGGMVRLWDAATGTLEEWDDYGGDTRVFGIACPGQIQDAAISPDGAWLAATWFETSMGELCHVTATTQAPRDGRGPSGWSRRSGGPFHGEIVRPGHSGQLRTLPVVFSPDGYTLARGGVGWNYDHVEVQPPILEHHGPGFWEVTCALAFSPDGRYLAAGGEDGSLTLWEWQSTKDPRAAKPVFLRRLEPEPAPPR